MTSSPPLVSVIIPTHGRSSALTVAIESVLLQDYASVEVIVVDDNGADSPMQHETASSISHLTTLDNVSYFVREDNGGGSAARNTGISLATGSLITFLDDDDAYHSSKVRLQVEHLLKHHLDVSVCDMDYIRDGVSINTPGRFARADNLVDFLLDGNVYTPMIMARRDALLCVGGFTDTPRYQDHLLMLKLLAVPFKVGHLSQSLFIHNDHSGERISNLANARIGFMLRAEMEEEYLDMLGRIDRSRILLRHDIMRAKLAKADHRWVGAVVSLCRALKNVIDMRGFTQWLKAARIVLFRKVVNL